MGELAESQQTVAREGKVTHKKKEVSFTSRILQCSCSGSCSHRMVIKESPAPSITPTSSLPIRWSQKNTGGTVVHLVYYLLNASAISQNSFSLCLFQASSFYHTWFLLPRFCCSIVLSSLAMIYTRMWEMINKIFRLAETKEEKVKPLNINLGFFFFLAF